jgi:hypothetical protein
MSGKQPKRSSVGKNADIDGLLTATHPELETGGTVPPPLRTSVLGHAKVQPLACGADAATLFNNQVIFHEAKDEKAHRIISQADDLVRDVIAIEKVMARLVAAKSQLFRWPLETTGPQVRRSKHGAAPPSRGPARLARDFLAILRLNVDEIRRAFPTGRHRLHPLVELFERHMARHGLWRVFKPLNSSDVNQLNASIEAMRQESKSATFRRHLDGHLKQVRDNTRSALELIDALCAAHSQLVVVRIDLSYRRHPLKGWLALPVMDGNAFGDRARLIRYLMRKCPCRPVAYVWKTEWAEHTGWHTHMLLFFDGNQHQHDITIARMIGKYWDEDITRGNGRHHISNLDQHQQRGVGKIRYDDAAKLWALCTIVVPYVTKADYYIRFIVPPKTRTFARSKVPHVSAKKLGRPRIKTSARVLSYTGLLNQPNYSSRKQGKQRSKLKRGREQAQRKHHFSSHIPYRSLTMEEYKAKGRESEVLGNNIWPYSTR